MFSNLHRRAAYAVAAGLPLAALALLSGATTAGAAPVPSAQTHIGDTGDSGSNGNVWAIDADNRTLTITETGHTGAGPSAVYDYTAHVSDKGTFKTVKGAEDPNSTGTEQNAADGTFTGTADYSFTANTLPTAHANLGVPTSITRTGAYESRDPIGAGGVSSLTPDDAGTSYWYALAFRTGTTFGGTGIGAYSYVYKTGCETWTDASNVTAANSGNITGRICKTTHPAPTPTPTHTVPPSGSRSHGYVHSLYATGLCLDNKDAHWVDSNPVQLWACGASAGGVAGGDQQLRIHDGHLQFMHDGAAWDVTSLGAGSQAVIEAPGNGVGAQGITRDGDYYVASNHSVLDDRAFGDKSGTEVLFYAQNGGKNQLWSAPK